MSLRIPLIQNNIYRAGKLMSLGRYQQSHIFGEYTVTKPETYPIVFENIKRSSGNYYFFR